MKKLSIFLIVLLLTSCAGMPHDEWAQNHEQLRNRKNDTSVNTPQSLEQRQIETRRYDGISERDLITASINLLQDLGFNFENSETELGTIIASKQRDTEGLEASFTHYLSHGLLLLVLPVTKDQITRVAIVVRPVLDSNGETTDDSHLVRVTFQSIALRTNSSTSGKTLSDPELYQGFFEKLSKSVFLEAREI
jgi:hypothetical protein